MKKKKHVNLHSICKSWTVFAPSLLLGLVHWPFICLLKWHEDLLCSLVMLISFHSYAPFYFFVAGDTTLTLEEIHAVMTFLIDSQHFSLLLSFHVGGKHHTFQYNPHPLRLFAIIVSVTALNTKLIFCVSVAHVRWTYISFSSFKFFASNCLLM